MNEALHWRQEGKLLKTALNVCCPVVAIHGGYNPHPWKGVFEPLEPLGKKFKPYLLEQCGHYPWLEEYACKDFSVSLDQKS